MIDLGSLVARIQADLAPLQASLQEAERSMRTSSEKMSDSLKTTDRSIQDIGKSLTKVGKQMTLMVTLPMAGIAGGAIKMSKDFDLTMSRISGLVGVAEDQVAAWGQEILQLSPALGKGPKEMAEALYFITSAGIKASEAMDVLKMSTRAAAAGLGDTGVIADLVTSAINAYGVQNMSAAKATDILVAAVREGKAEAPDLAASLGQVLPIAAEMNITFDQVAATTAAMTRTGTDAAQAATQLRGIMSALLKPSKQAEDALSAMGTSSEELRKIIREQGLLDGLMKLRSVTKEYGEEAMAMVMPNIRALAGVLDLMGSNVADNIKIFAALENVTGDSDRAFAAYAETVEAQFDTAMHNSQAAMIQLGQSIQHHLMPVLLRLSNLLKAVSIWFTQLPDAGKNVVLVIGGLVMAIGPLLTAIGFMITTLIPKFIVGLQAIKIAIHGVSTAIMTTPLGLLIGLLSLASAGLTIFALRAREAKNEQLGLKDAIEGMDMGSVLLHWKALSVNLSGGGLSAMGLKLNLENLQRLMRQMSQNELSTLSDYLKDKLATANRTSRIEVEKFGESSKETTQFIADLQEALRLLGVEFKLFEEIVEPPPAKPPGILESLSKQLEDLQNAQGLIATRRELGEINKKIREAMESMEFWNTYTNDMHTPITAMSTAYDYYRRGMISVRREIELVGVASQQIMVDPKVVETLTKMGMAAGEAYSLLGTTTTQFSTLKDIAMPSMDAINEKFDATINQAEMIANLISEVLSEAFTAALFNGQNFFKSLWQGLEALIKKLIAAAVAALVLSTVLSAAFGGFGPASFATTGKAGGGFGSLFMKMFGKTMGIPGLLKGGVIPEGFPNDSYLARLTSNEVVLPAPQALTPSMFGFGMDELDVNVYGQIAGDVIHITNRRFEQKKSWFE